MTLYPAFSAHPAVRGGQLQTYVGTLFSGNTATGPHHVKRVALADGDELQLHINEPPINTVQTTAIVLLLHGLGGSSTSAYMLRIASKLNRQGVTTVRFNHRGCGDGGAPLARGIYHAGRVEDIHAAVVFCAQVWPDRPLLIAGFSLSGNMLLRYLGEAGRGTGPTPPRHVAAALAVCPPVDLEACSLALSKAINLPIDRHYTQILLATAARRRILFPDLAHPRLLKPMNLRKFDAIYTAPLAGFSSRDDYYKQSSAKHTAHAIRIPTLIVAADDDPIIPPDSLACLKLSSQVQLQIQRSGGHMGFIARNRTEFGDYRWMDAMVVAWVKSQISG